MIESTVIFLIALAAVALSSRFVISSSIKISEHFQISQLAVGYLLIATATSVPDLMVSASASYQGHTGIAIGDILGSSIANICLVLGAAALIKTIHVKREQTLESAELLLLVTMIPLVLLTRQVIGPSEGGVLILIFCLYAFFAIKEKFTMGLKEGVSHKEWIHQVTIFVFAVAVTIISAQFIVTSGADIARQFGINEAVLGMTIIAFGTTLPELAIGFTAVRKGHYALAIGDIFGSCVVNLTLGLGIASIIHPLSDGAMFIQTGIAFLIGLVMFVWYVLMKHEGIRREHGLVLILAYILFIMMEMTWGFSTGM